MGKPATARKRVTNVAILAQLVHGSMTCVQLAQALDAAPERVQTFLDSLLQSRRICIDTRVMADVSYCAVRAIDVSNQLLHERSDWLVAGPAVPPDLTSRLTGYDESIRRHVALCMMARTR